MPSDIRAYVQFDEATGEVIRTLYDAPLHNVCPTCYWHHGLHAPWCEDPRPYECIAGCEEVALALIAVVQQIGRRVVVLGPVP